MVYQTQEQAKIDRTAYCAAHKGSHVLLGGGRCLQAIAYSQPAAACRIVRSPLTKDQEKS